MRPTQQSELRLAQNSSLRFGGITVFADMLRASGLMNAFSVRSGLCSLSTAHFVRLLSTASEPVGSMGKQLNYP